MARTSDVNSAQNQFFINHKDNNGLDYPRNGGYAVFGKVIDGMDVVDKIAKVKTTIAREGAPGNRLKTCRPRRSSSRRRGGKPRNNGELDRKIVPGRNP